MQVRYLFYGLGTPVQIHVISRILHLLPVCITEFRAGVFSAAPVCFLRLLQVALGRIGFYRHQKLAASLSLGTYKISASYSHLGRRVAGAEPVVVECFQSDLNGVGTSKSCLVHLGSPFC